jgi:protein TonB
MFESTQEAQGLHDVDRKLGTFSAAVLAHVGVGFVIVAVTALIVPPVRGPVERPILVITPPVLPGDLIPRPVLPAPKRGTNATKPGATFVPRAAPEPVPPLTPAPPATIATDTAPPGPEGPGDGTAGDPNGSPNGVLGGIGDADAGPGGGSNPEPAYLTADMQRPVLLVKVEPAYPEVARRAGIGGRVTVRAVIGEDGGVESAEVVASKNPMFDQTALDAVRRWRYRPALMNGKPVRVYFVVVVDFIVR